MSLYESIFRDAGIKRLGEVNIITLPQGYGGLVMDAVDFILLRKWAQRRSSTENFQRDMQLLLDQIDMAISRTGSTIATKGNGAMLTRLVARMKTAGLDLSDWNVPQKIIGELEKRPAPDPGFKRSEPLATAADTRTAADSFQEELQQALAEFGLRPV